MHHKKMNTIYAKSPVQNRGSSQAHIERTRKQSKYASDEHYVAHRWKN